MIKNVSFPSGRYGVGEGDEVESGDSGKTVVNSSGQYFHDISCIEILKS